MPTLKPGTYIPTGAEADALVAAAMADPDAPELTDEQWERVVPHARVGLKVPVTMRLDSDVAAHFRSSGRGWQTRINEILRKFVNHELAEHD